MSGCILGWCPVCDIEVYEGEWSGKGYELFDKFIHEGGCYRKYARQKEQRKNVRELEEELEGLRIENERLIKENGKLGDELRRKIMFQKIKEEKDKLLKQNEAHIRLKKDRQDDKVIRYK
jgi:hypothetical protein